MIRERLVKILDSLGEEDLLTIDFSGVDVMTPSFADESIGKFAERIGRNHFRSRVSLVGAAETIRALVNSILAERIPSDERKKA